VKLKPPEMVGDIESIRVYILVINGSGNR
jgi:hypothetical protein